MPKYKVQLKQGKRTLVEYGEFKSVAACQAFYETLTTMKLTEILKVEYEDETEPPVDDFNYRSLFKGVVANKQTRQSRQVILHNIKLSKNESDIYSACVEYMDLNGSNIDSITATLFKT